MFLMSKNYPTSCETCTRTFCTDGPCTIREKKNNSFNAGLRILARACKEERAAAHSDDRSEQCWNCPIANVCSQYIGDSATLDKMANEAVAAIKEYEASTKKREPLECESRSCAYNNDGICRYADVFDKDPEFKEGDGCVSGVVAI